MEAYESVREKINGITLDGINNRLDPEIIFDDGMVYDDHLNTLSVSNLKITGDSLPNNNTILFMKTDQLVHSDTSFTYNSSSNTLTVGTVNCTDFNTTSTKNIVYNVTTTTSNNASITLTSVSNYIQRLTGTGTLSVTLPVGTTVQIGHSFLISNGSASNITVKNNSGGTVTTVLGSSSSIVTCFNNTTSDGIWSPRHLFNISGITGVSSSDLVFSTNPTLVNPVLGNSTATSLAIGESLNSSSVVDIASTTKGFLIPRMTTTQRNAISLPAIGLQIYNTDLNSLNYYDGNFWNNYSNNSPFDKKGFRLTSTWVSFGDSYGDPAGINGVSGWPSRLATLSSTTVVNKNISGTTIDYPFMTYNFMDNPITNSSYANYSSIVEYGCNDQRINRALFTDGYYYCSVYLNLIVTMSVPWSSILDARSWTTKSGTYSNTPAYNFGLGVLLNGYIENSFTGRYYGISFTVIPSKPTSFEIYVDTILVETLSINYPSGYTGGFSAIMYLLDMKTSATRTIRVKVTGTTGGDSGFINYGCSWDDNSSNKRDVLCISCPRLPVSASGTGGDVLAPSDSRWLSINENIKECVNTAQKFSLPVYYHRWANSTLGFQTDLVHPNDKEMDYQVKNMYDNTIVH